MIILLMVLACNTVTRVILEMMALSETLGVGTAIDFSDLEMLRMIRLSSLLSTDKPAFFPPVPHGVLRLRWLITKAG